MNHHLHEELTAYIDGELPQEQQRQMEAALAKEPSLRSLERRLRRSIEAVESLPLPATSPALRRAVLEAIAQPTFWERWFTLPRLIPVGLVMAVTAVAVVTWPRANEEGLPADEEKLLLAQNLEVVEDLDLVDLDSPDDFDVVAQLHDLEVAQ